MKRPSILKRARLGYKVFQQGMPRAPRQRKIADRYWRPLLEGKPSWHLTNYEAYCEEGFAGNALIYAAIMYKVRAKQSVTLRAYTGDPDHLEPLSPENELSQMLARPNAHQSWKEFQALNEVYLNIDGNSYIYISREDGTLRSLRPDRVYVIPGPTDPKPTIIGFKYVPHGKTLEQGYSLFVEDIIHTKLPNPYDPLEGLGYGLSPLSSGAQSTDVDNSATAFLKKFFDSGTMLNGVLRFKQPLDDEDFEEVSERWEEQYGGSSNWTKTGVLDRDGEYTRLGMTFEEMGFESLDERNESRVLSPLGVPAILLSTRLGLERSTYSNYELARQMCWEDVLLPELQLFEEEYQANLGSPGVTIKFDLSKVPALQKDIYEQIKAAELLYRMRVPAQVAFKTVGLEVEDYEGGDDVPPVSARGGGGDYDEE